MTKLWKTYSCRWQLIVEWSTHKSLLQSVCNSSSDLRVMAFWEPSRERVADLQSKSIVCLVLAYCVNPNYSIQGTRGSSTLSLSQRIRLHWPKSPDRLIMRRGNGSNKENAIFSRMMLNEIFRLGRLAADLLRVFRAISDQDGMKWWLKPTLIGREDF